MSQVSHISDCPETMEEARQIIKFVDASREEERNKNKRIKEALKEYMAHSSIDGNVKRQELRAKLMGFIN